jgi:protein-tyrosine phosphatase
MRHFVDEAGLTERILIDSAGTGDWHIGETPDERAQHAARRRGYELGALRGRQVTSTDFERFDLLVAMDERNVAALYQLCPPAHRDKIRLLMEFMPEMDHRSDGAREVVDPYFGGAEGFEQVLDQCEAACRGLIAVLRAHLLI